MSVKEFMSNCMDSLQEASPRIKIVVGVVGLVGAGIAACVASAKVKEETKKERQAFKDIHKIRHAQHADKTGEKLDPEEEVSADVKFVYTDKDYAKDVTHMALSFGKKILKLYGVPFAIGVMSIALILNGTNTLNTRYLAMSALAAKYKDSLDEFVKRVKDKYGEEVANDIQYGLMTEKVKEEEVDEETGEKKKVTKEIKVAESDPTACSPYAFIFDDRFGEFTNDISYNERLAKFVQDKLNTALLTEKKYVTLNDLYELFKAPEEMYDARSMVVGWRRKDNVNEDNDGFVNLRIQRIFINVEGKRVPRILIDPNVEGNIYNKVLRDCKYAA